MRIWLSLLLAGLMAAPGVADIRVVRNVQTEMMAGLGGGPKESTTWISGDKHREELKTQGKPSLLERMAGVGRPEITRLDKKVRWVLDVPQKRYEETSLVIPVQERAEEKSQKEDDAAGAEQKPTTKITKAEFKTTPLNQKKKIGEFDCEGYQVRALLEMEDLETRKKTEMRMITTLWTTPETGAIAQLKKEEVAYSQAYLKVIGMADAKDAMKNLGTTMLAGLAGSGEKELSSALAGMPAELKKVKGYPIVSQVEWFSQGDETAPESTEVSPDAAELPSDMAGALGGFAANFAKKKMDAKKAPPSSDGNRMFSITTEIKSVSVSALPADTFEIPAGFKKAK